MKNTKGILKIVSLLVLCFVMVLTFALIPLNLFWINFPEWVPVLLSIFFCGGLAVYLIVFKTRLVTRILLPVIFGFFAVVCSFAPYILPYWNSYSFKGYDGVILNYNEVISSQEAVEDLDTLKGYLEKVHPLFMDGLTEDVENLYLQVKERLEKAGNVTVNGFRREIQTILHSINDAHTTTYNNFPDDKYLKAYIQKAWEGYDVISINGKTVRQIFEDARPYYCYETEDWISIDLVSLATLDFLEYSEPFVYEWTNGETVISEEYTEMDFVSGREYNEIYDQFYPSDDEPRDFVYYEIDEEKSLAILTLTQCFYDQAYIDCVKSMFTEVKEKNIRNVAVDLRGNGGGNSLVANEFVKYLPVDSFRECPCDWRLGFLNIYFEGKVSNRRNDSLAFDGKVYILTDNGTFSSAKDFAMIIQDNHLGEIVGEPSANAVNSYGDVVWIYLPNTGMFAQISSKKWYRIDRANTDDYVIPDHPCAGEDCLESLYELVTARPEG